MLITGLYSKSKSFTTYRVTLYNGFATVQTTTKLIEGGHRGF